GLDADVGRAACYKMQVLRRHFAEKLVGTDHLFNRNHRECSLMFLSLDIMPSQGFRHKPERRLRPHGALSQPEPAGCFASFWLCWSARASAVRSIPTGHHVMQRPQPTQPNVPN